MALQNCKYCGKLFMQVKSPYCQECQQLHDNYYFAVRDYVKANPKSTIMDIHNKTGIPLSKIIEFQKAEYMPFAK